MSLAHPGAEPTVKLPSPYSAPSEAEVRLAIARQVGAEEMEAVWDAACRSAGARRGGAPLGAAELAPIAAHLARQEGPLRLVGRSLELRIRILALLSAATTPSRP